MKLIDADTARRIIDSPRNKVQMLNMLERTPTVEIIRCKDCAYYNVPKGMTDWCDVWGNITREEDFCSQAERRKE